MGRTQVLQPERTAVALDLLAAHAEGGRELPHQARLLRYGDLPDAEEAQHVVNTDGIEVLLHPPVALAHPVLQPLTSYL